MVSVAVSLFVVLAVAVAVWMDVRNLRAERTGRLWSQLTETERLALALRERRNDSDGR